jgi:hypothetical protein
MQDDQLAADERLDALRDAIANAADPKDVTLGLPALIDGGRFEFTFMATQYGSSDPVAFDVWFDWEPGNRHAVWWQDISGLEAISPGSSAPVWGWASWRNGDDLLLAMTSHELELEGWARVPGGAPTAGADPEADDEETLRDPGRWLRLAKHIQAVIGEEWPPGTESQFYDQE